MLNQCSDGPVNPVSCVSSSTFYYDLDIGSAQRRSYTALSFQVTLEDMSQEERWLGLVLPDGRGVVGSAGGSADARSQEKSSAVNSWARVRATGLLDACA